MKPLVIENLNEVPESKGIYKLYAVTIKGVPIPIQRFRGIDNQGILYIGRTTKQTLKKRIYNLLATSRKISKTTNHSGGLKYRTNPVIQKTLVDHLLYFYCETSDDPKQRETELLKEYSLKFGEYPPLNK